MAPIKALVQFFKVQITDSIIKNTVGNLSGHYIENNFFDQVFAICLCRTKFNMTENIRLLFGQMDKSTKKDALTCLMDEFNVESIKLVENDWIIARGAPEPFQERIVDVLQALLRKQSMPTGK